MRYNKWLESCLQCGIPAISTDTSARIMAVLYEYGNNEGFTYNHKFLADKDYIQKKFGLHEMGIVEPKFHTLLKQYVQELQHYQRDHKDERFTDKGGLKPIAPDWVPQLLKDRYKIDFIG